MPKNVKDIQNSKDENHINMSDENDISKNNRLKKNPYRLIKHRTPIRKIRDINQKTSDEFIYIKGKHYKKSELIYNTVKLFIIGFFIILVINSLNIYASTKKIEKNIIAQAHEGYGFLIDAAKNTKSEGFTEAIESFSQANQSFQNAEDEIWFIGFDSTIYAEKGNLTFAVKNLLESGQHFAQSGEYFIQALSEFEKIPVYFINTNTNESQLHPSITTALKKGLEKTNLAITEIDIASEKIGKVDINALPKDLKEQFIIAKEKIEEISDTLNDISKHFPAIVKLLGDRYPHRILILLQNNSEVRATGGFIGSYAILDINDGYIENLRIEDVYDIDGSYGGQIKPSYNLDNFVDNWRFRDSNYSPDFPTSAKKAQWFLEEEGGPSVDTVIAINQGLLTDLLNITGPIKVGEFIEFNSENYQILLTYIVEGKIWGAEDPKHILKVFIPLFKEQILKEEKLSKLASKLYKAVEQEHIVMYSNDEEIQALFEHFKLDGKVHEIEVDEDYLSVINTSIGGTKSDQFIEQTINHTTHINADGSIINEVRITRSHLWSDEIYQNWERLLQEYGFSLSDFSDSLIDVLGRGKNIVNMQIYIPKNSTLIESSDNSAKIYHDTELDRDYIMTKIEVEAGNTSEITVKYKIPLILEKSDNTFIYKIFVDKQIGTRGGLLNKTITFDDKLENISTYPEAQIKTSEKIEYSTNLVYDRYFSGMWVW